ncbi:UNVERIFIED_CONTAM: hypothetical protein K2H54_031328 [Gekko kuhli]
MVEEEGTGPASWGAGFPPRHQQVHPELQVAAAAEDKACFADPNGKYVIHLEKGGGEEEEVVGMLLVQLNLSQVGHRNPAVDIMTHRGSIDWY